MVYGVHCRLLFKPRIHSKSYLIDNAKVLGLHKENFLAVVKFALLLFTKVLVLIIVYKCMISTRYSFLWLTTLRMVSVPHYHMQLRESCTHWCMQTQSSYPLKTMYSAILKGCSPLDWAVRKLLVLQWIDLKTEYQELNYIKLAK